VSTTIEAGGLLVLDPSDKRVIQFDWDTDALPAGVEIATPSGSTFTITAIQQSGLTALTKDQESIVSGNRKTQLRLVATTATVGDRYLVANQIVTNESPAQTIERQFEVLIQNQ
jgi:hypothetical protein